MRDDEKLCPWPFEALSRQPQSADGMQMRLKGRFYAASAFGVLSSNLKRPRKLAMPPYMMVSDNHYRGEGWANSHRRLKNVIAVMDWIPNTNALSHDGATLDTAAASRAAALGAQAGTLGGGLLSALGASGPMAPVNAAQPVMYDGEMEAALKRTFDVLDTDSAGTLSLAQLADFLRIHDVAVPKGRGESQGEGCGDAAPIARRVIGGALNDVDRVIAALGIDAAAAAAAAGATKTSGVGGQQTYEESLRASGPRVSWTTAYAMVRRRTFESLEKGRFFVALSLPEAEGMRAMLHLAQEPDGTRGAASKNVEVRDVVRRVHFFCLLVLLFAHLFSLFLSPPLVRFIAQPMLWGSGVALRLNNTSNEFVGGWYSAGGGAEADASASFAGSGRLALGENSSAVSRVLDRR